MGAIALNTIDHGEASANADVHIVHGLFGSARNWGAIAKRMSDRGRVRAVDLRNHGDSPWDDAHDYPAMAADLASLISDPVDLVGHSMGGKAAMVLALTAPHAIRRLVIADIAPVTYQRSYDDHISAMRSLDPAQFERRSDAAAALGIDDPGVRDFLLQSLDLKAGRWKLNVEVLAREMPRILGFPDFVGQFTGPTLFLSGGASGYVTAGHRGLIKSLFPNAKFAKIPGAGHWLHAENPRAFEAALRAFFD